MKIRPLSNSQKLFLQRLMVAHVLTDDEAKDLYSSIRDKFANVEVSDNDDNSNPNYMGDSFDHCLGLINVSLKPAFNLEICTAYLPPPYDQENTSNQPLVLSSRSQSPSLVKYHAVVNRSNDLHAKVYGSSPSSYGPHELAYFRLILEKLVDRGNDMDNHVGCLGVMNRMDLINSRTEMEGAHAAKLTVDQTEAALELFISEKWLVEMAPPDDDADSEEELEGHSSKRKRSVTVGRHRRKSLKGTFYGIGPRCFLELAEFLQSVGLPGERMPQTIINLP